MRRRVSSSTGALTLVSAKSGIVSEASEMEAEREREGGPAHEVERPGREPTRLSHQSAPDD